jgi:hypothetical protein
MDCSFRKFEILFTGADRRPAHIRSSLFWRESLRVETKQAEHLGYTAFIPEEIVVVKAALSHFGVKRKRRRGVSAFAPLQIESGGKNSSTLES